MLTFFHLQDSFASNKSSQEEDTFHSDSDPSQPPSARWLSQRRFTFEFDAQPTEDCASTPTSVVLASERVRNDLLLFVVHQSHSQ